MTGGRGTPLILAFDTSTAHGSVALAAGAVVVSDVDLSEARQHAAGLVPAVHRVLEEGGAAAERLDGLVVGSGPGSFTGVRIAAATAKGLVAALGIPLWTFSSLAAGAVSPVTKTAHGLRYVLFDARGERVYAACYDVTPTRCEEVLPPSATEIHSVLASQVPDGAAFCGSGALRHAARIRGAGYAVLPIPHGIPTARGLIRLLAHDPATAPLSAPARWEPDYLKASGAAPATPPSS